MAKTRCQSSTAVGITFSGRARWHFRACIFFVETLLVQVGAGPLSFCFSLFHISWRKFACEHYLPTFSANTLACVHLTRVVFADLLPMHVGQHAIQLIISLHFLFAKPIAHRRANVTISNVVRQPKQLERGDKKASKRCGAAC